MKFIITADIHFGSRNDQGFSMQTKYTEQAPELVHALGQAAVEQGAEFIIHAGDMITYGTAEEIKTAAQCCTTLPVPFYTVLGNHDCIREDFEQLWLEHGAAFFPERTLETTLIRGGLRFDLLTNYWGGILPFMCRMPDSSPDWNSLNSIVSAPEIRRSRTASRALGMVRLQTAGSSKASRSRAGLRIRM